MYRLKKIFRTFFLLLDHQDRKKFCIITFLVFISGLLSLLSIGAVLPFLSLLMSPEKNILLKYFPAWSAQHLLIFAATALIGAYWIKNIAAWTCLFIQSKLLNEISFKMGHRVFTKYMHAPYLWHLKRSTPDLIRNINNESVTYGSVVLGLGTFFTELFSSTLLILALLCIDYKFTLVVTVPLLISIILFLRYTRVKTKFYGENRVLAWAAMVKYVLQGLGGLKETAIYHKQDYFLRNFQAQSQIMVETTAFSGVFQQSPRFIIEAIALTVILIMSLFFIMLGYSNQQILILLSIMGIAAVQLLPSLNRMMAGMAQIIYGLPALYIIAEELMTDYETKEERNYVGKNQSINFIDKISLVDLCFSYHSEKNTGFQSISLEIKKGEKVAFMGYSGAGKTTLVDVICGLIEPEHGKILIDGIEITHANRIAWQEKLGYVPQMIYIYDCSIRENVAFAEFVENIDDEKIWQALDVANLKSFIESLPQGLDTLVGENGVRLSGGQRQRLGIARAIYRNPTILIMDEATSSLDNKTEEEVTEAINRASSNRTLITVAHRVSTVKNSDIIYLLNQGNLIARGKYEELIQSSPEFRRMIGNEKRDLLVSV